MADLLLLGTFFAYLGASALCAAYLCSRKEAFCRLGSWVLGAGLILHTLALGLWALEFGRLPMATLGEAVLLLSWALVAAHLFLYWRQPIKVLGALAAPLAAVMVSGGLLLPGGRHEVSPLLNSFWVSLHALLALVGVASLSLAGLGGLLYLIQERQIKRKRFGFFYRRLPSLEQLDALNYQCLRVGFPFLTAGIVTGSLYAQYALGSFFNFDPKEILTLIAWLLYAVLLHERLASGWRGRRAALLALGGFAVLIFTFVGAGLWLAGYHSFGHFSTRP